MAESIRISDEEAISEVERYATLKDVSATEAAARLIKTAVKRLAASRKWAQAHPAKKPAKKAKPVKKTAAKKPAKKVKVKFIPDEQVEIPHV